MRKFFSLLLFHKAKCFIWNEIEREQERSKFSSSQDDWLVLGDGWRGGNWAYTSLKMIEYKDKWILLLRVCVTVKEYLHRKQVHFLKCILFKHLPSDGHPDVLKHLMIKQLKWETCIIRELPNNWILPISLDVCLSFLLSYLLDINDLAVKCTPHPIFLLEHMPSAPGLNCSAEFCGIPRGKTADEG